MFRTAILVLTLAAVPMASAHAAGTAETAPAKPADAVLQHYLAIQTALAADSLTGVADHARALAKLPGGAAATDAAEPAAGTSAAEMPAIAAAAGRLAAADDLKSARKAFGELSAPVVRYRDALSGPRPHVAFCPMAGKEWLQEGDVIANPYYGSAMLRCGSIVRK